MAIGGQSSVAVTFFGVRGSTPCHGDDIAHYGGNTSCVAVCAPDHDPIVFDLGTGLRYFGMTQPVDGTFRGTCLLSHLHWDHTQGLPFFTPILREGAEFDIYAPLQADGRPVVDAMRTFIQPPHFPIVLEHIPGTIRFHDIGDDDFTVGRAAVRSRLIPHVGNTLGYRVTIDGVSVAYLSDHQQPYDGSMHLSDGARELIEGVDLLIHDAQYTVAEFEHKRTWGHCTVDFAVWAATECGVGTLALFHHDPVRCDASVRVLLEAARKSVHGACNVIAAREGKTVTLAPRG